MNKEFHPPARVLMGPGPSNIDPRVLLAMAKPMVGHLDPDFIRIMNNLQELLRMIFGTKKLAHHSHFRYRECGNGSCLCQCRRTRR